MRVAAGAIARRVLGRASASVVRWCRWAQDDRPVAMGLGSRRRQSLLLSRPGRRRGLGDLSRRSAQGGLLCRRRDRGRGRWRAARARCPIYAKLDADLASALMGINAVKGVEIGDGFACCRLDRRGERGRDAHAGGAVIFGSNHAGGILGGISTGQPVSRASLSNRRVRS